MSERLTEHWREHCRIKTFVIPYEKERFMPAVQLTFMSKSGHFEHDTYDCIGTLVHSGVPQKVKYKRRALPPPKP